MSFRPWATAGLTPPGPGDDGPFDAVFVAKHRLDSWLETVPEARHRFVLGLAPHAAAMDEVPDGYQDYIAEAHRFVDAPPRAYWAIRPVDRGSLDGTTHQQWADVAHGIAAAHGIRAGDRVLVDTADQEQPVIWLLAPLLAGASIVLCAGLDRSTLDERVAVERVTHVF